MAILRHPDLPGRTITYPDEAVETLARSGWVDAYPAEPEAEPSATHPEGEAEPEADPAAEKKKK